jgi:two-component system OmpR family response regulator
MADGGSEQPEMNVSDSELAENRSVPRGEGADRVRADGRPADAVLVVCADPEIAKEVTFRLESEGHPVRVSQTVRDALRAARAGGLSAMVVDRVLKGGDDGLTIVETLRREGNFLPALVVGPLSTADDRIREFKAGADQYLAKPFDARELVARVEALLRRARDPRARLRCGDIEMDLVARTVRCAGRQVDLLPTEFRLLEYLMRHPDQPLSRAELIKDVWNSRYTERSNVVDVQVGNLRRRLDPTGERRYVVNVRGVGFRLKGDP